MIIPSFMGRRRLGIDGLRQSPENDSQSSPILTSCQPRVQTPSLYLLSLVTKAFHPEIRNVFHGRLACLLLCNVVNQPDVDQCWQWCARQMIKIAPWKCQLCYQQRCSGTPSRTSCPGQHQLNVQKPRSRLLLVPSEILLLAAPAASTTCFLKGILLAVTVPGWELHDDEYSQKTWLSSKVARVGEKGREGGRASLGAVSLGLERQHCRSLT